MPGLKEFIAIVFGGKKIHPDMAIIQQIEKQTGKKLKPMSNLGGYNYNGYGLDIMGQVKVLNLDSNVITDISFLMNIYGLIHLSLDNNQITDLTPLRGLRNLKTLWLLENQITDLTPIFFSILGDRPVSQFHYEKEDAGRGNPAPTLTFKSYEEFGTIGDLFVFVKVGARFPRPQTMNIEC